MLGYFLVASAARRNLGKGGIRMIDPHRIRAAELFGIDPSEVTDEQRQYAKMDAHARSYGAEWISFASFMTHKTQKVYYPNLDEIHNDDTSEN